MKAKHPPEMNRFVLSPEDLVKESSPNGEKPNSSKRERKQKREIDFYQFPPEIVEAILNANYDPVWRIVAALLLTHYKDYEKKNPILLTSKMLRRFGVSRGMKFRGLRALVRTGRFEVDQFPGKNPRVFVKDLPLKE